MQQDDVSLQELKRAAIQMRAHKLPGMLEAYACNLHAAALIAEGGYEEALEVLQQMEEAGGLTPIVQFQRGSVYLETGKFEEAIAEFRGYTEILGFDEILHEQLSDCHFQQGALPKALDHALKGLAIMPNSPGCLASMAVSLPQERWSEIAERMQVVKGKENRETAYAMMMGYSYDLQLADLFDHLYVMLETEYPKSEVLEYYE